MKQSDAKILIEHVTRDHLATMFERAKTGVTDWKAVSASNPYKTKGAAWNLLYGCFTTAERLRYAAIKHMIWEFGDFLDPELLELIEKPKRERAKIVPMHEEPIFEVAKP